MPTFLEETPIVDFHAPSIRALIEERQWERLNDYDRIGAAYTFVKDDLPFGYNRSDDLKASEVLRDGYGQCNTKGNLLVALLRALGQPTRVRGFTIDKALQIGAIPPWLGRFAPERILHSWVEVKFQGRWVPLEGFILDAPYLSALQRRFAHVRGAFCGYGVATLDLHRPDVAWRGEATYIQKEGIVDDFGLFDHPDALYEQHGTNLRGVRRVLYSAWIRHVMNRRVASIRSEGRQVYTKAQQVS